ncbi:hypothetical protein D9611_005258 [Ephemerocybe angulata]|uniref:Uncharacterized protein n=1 Tax=Ephemerocybe angulata TaxID=980116 RepID=A0A8H5C0Q3_9AGAR|nr:hypothetical protein D9611_005258 [Tulosesus angulatus]
MDQCLNTAELIPLICETLDQGTAFAFSLTKKNFLEPALNIVWHRISSFKPFLACVPTDLWRSELTGSGMGRDRVPVAHLQRSLAPNDLQRYLNYYAPRIRELSLVDWKREDDPILSPAFLRALQLATSRKPGALAPSLLFFEWVPIMSLRVALGDEIAQHLPMFMSLFLGPNVLSARLELGSTFPGETSTTYDATRTLNKLKELFLSIDDTELVNDYLSTFTGTWTNLETLHLAFVDNDGIALLASLPRLKSLKINNCEVIPSYPPGDLPGPSYIPHNMFSALEVAYITTNTIEEAIGFIQQLPPKSTAFRKLRLHTMDKALYPDAQHLIGAIEIHCNPDVLESVIWVMGMTRTYEGRCYDESKSVDLDDMLNIDGLFEFHKLTRLDLRLKTLVRVTPDQAMRMSKAFPKMTRLHLRCHSFYSSFPPLIDHTHLLAILKGCPALKSLNIRFDATRITGLESVPGFSSSLSKLHVGDSHICSPTRVADFINANLEALDELTSYDNGCFGGYNIFHERWKVVVEDVLGPQDDDSSVQPYDDF